MTRLARARGTAPWLALYAVGLLCVFSFVLFEVLDVDGSEFEYAPSRLSIKLAEAQHDDVKRLSLWVVGLTPAPVVAVALAEPPPAITREPSGARRMPAPLARTSHAALPRARLSDVPPSA